MTFSYKIIKSDNTRVSTEGIEVASNFVAKQQIMKEPHHPHHHKPDISSHEVLKEEDKAPYIKAFQAELKREKEKLIENARQEAKRIREEAQKNGYEEGFKKGFSEGEQNALDEYRDLLERSKKVLWDAEKQTKEYLEVQKENLIRLAGDIAEKIVNHEINTEGETLSDMIKQVLQEYKKGGVLLISCNKKHVRKLKDNIFSLKKINGDIDYIVMENPAFEENRVMLEYDNEIIDLGVSDQIQSIVNQLIEMEV